MRRQSLLEITLLAEDTPAKYFSKGHLDIDVLLEDELITQSFGSYEDSFDGLLECEEGDFHIYLNKNRLNYANGAKSRFTKAHEYGHFKIAHHKRELLAGKSLSFGAETIDSEKKKIEKEANHFASYLLMPRQLFNPFITSYGKGIEAIIEASKKFIVSIEAATIHYLNQNFFACLAIKWNTDFSVKNVYYSQKFKGATIVSGLPPVRINKIYLKDIVDSIKENGFRFHDAANFLSSWIADIPAGSINDKTVLEQTMRLGKYGGMTLLTI